MVRELCDYPLLDQRLLLLPLLCKRPSPLEAALSLPSWPQGVETQLLWTVPLCRKVVLPSLWTARK
jgi:hypothetical protein